MLIPSQITSQLNPIICSQATQTHAPLCFEAMEIRTGLRPPTLLFHPQTQASQTLCKCFTCINYPMTNAQFLNFLVTLGENQQSSPLLPFAPLIQPPVSSEMQLCSLPNRPFGTWSFSLCTRGSEQYKSCCIPQLIKPVQWQP